MAYIRKESNNQTLQSFGDNVFIFIWILTTKLFFFLLKKYSMMHMAASSWYEIGKLTDKRTKKVRAGMHSDGIPFLKN